MTPTTTFLVALAFGLVIGLAYTVTRWARTERALYALLAVLERNGWLLGPDEDGNVIIIIPDGEQE